MAALGDKISDFTLKDQHGKDFSLSEYSGTKKVLLSFHALAWTSL